MSMDDVVGLLTAVEWVYVVQVLWPTGLMLSVGLFLFRAERRKVAEVQGFLEEGREVLRRIKLEHEQASWLLGRMKEKIEERRRAASLNDCELQMDRIIRQDREDRKTGPELGVLLKAAGQALEEPRESVRRPRMVEVVNTATGIAYIVPKESAKKLEGCRRVSRTPQEMEEWERKVKLGEEIPF